MILRPQTVRRLLVLFAVVLVLVGAGAALYWRNEYRKATRLAEAREAGLAAYAAGDYQRALDSLRYYVSRDKNKSDAEALYAYGDSRSRIEDPNGKHIFEGISVFNAVITLDPDNLAAKHRLLDLSTQAWRNEEALELAEQILRSHPDDRDALRGKAIALERLRRLDEALAASETLNALDSKDLDQQLVTYELMRKLKRPPEALVARAQRQQKENPDDPRFAMLLGMALGNAGDAVAGREWLTRAATQPAPDATFVRHMVRVLDTLKMYPQSQGLLDRVSAQSGDPQILRVIVQRLWQNGQNARVLERLNDLDPASADSDTGLIAYRALATLESGDVAAGQKLLQALEARRTDNEAIAWATALKARFSALDARAALRQYQAALVRAPDNAVIRFLVGEAYARLGETELAIAAWRRAAELSPSWAKPHVEAARTLSGSGRVKEAITEAEAAVRAAPNQPDPIVTLAIVRHKALEAGIADPAEAAKLLELVEELQKLLPGEEETLPVYVNLLAQAARRDDAIAAARKVTARGSKFKQATMLRLAAISRVHKLGIEDELHAASSQGEETPRVALARAADLAAAGKPQDGLALLESRVKSATTQPVTWKLALAQYKEAIRDPSARRDWIALGDANPQDLSVQSTILKGAASARADRDFMARSIDRLKALTGPEGQTWKLERARWLLGGDEGKDTAEAVNILNEIVRTSPTLTDARLLMARAYESANNPAAAIKELQAAAEQAPNNTSIAVELGRLLQADGRFEDARGYLERAANSPELTEESCRRIAAMLAAQGDIARGVKVLESVRRELSRSGQLLLADLYRREQRPTDAEAIYTRLLAEAPTETDEIKAAADFYAGQGRIDEARKTLSRLAETRSGAGMADLIIAAFNERYIGQEDAQRRYRAAVTAAPHKPEVWQQLAGFHLRSGRYADAARVADEGLKNIPGDAALTRLAAATAKLGELSSQDPALAPALATLAAATGDDPAVLDFLSDASSTAPILRASGDAGPESMRQRLQQFAAQHPRSLALQVALIRLNVAMGRSEEAAQVAEKTLLAFPIDPEAARTAALAMREVGKLPEALDAARKWRERAQDNPRAADELIAELLLAQGQPAPAAKQLAPYAEALKAELKSNTRTLSLLLRAYAAAGEESKARAILEPSLSQDPAARMLWLELAESEIRDGDGAAAWVRQVEPLLKPSVEERMALAAAWYGLSVRHDIEEGAQHAAKVLDELMQKPEVPAEAFFLRAAVADHLADTKTAEECYRRGLGMQPDTPEALNNLAYLILLREGDLGEARNLAAKAVSLAPARPSFHDTFARVLSRQGERDAAIESFNRAIKLDPNSLEALIGLATVFKETGRGEQAAALLPRIETLLRAGPVLTPQLRSELESLRATMKASG